MTDPAGVRKPVAISMGAPQISEEDIAQVVGVLRSGRLREGPICQQFEQEFAAQAGARYALAVSSGTAALHIAYAALLQPGDEVLVPSFTFMATASMVRFANAQPVFCDVDPRTFTLDAADAEKRVTALTRAVVPVHLFGNSCDIEAFQKLAQRHRLRIIWDAAQSQGTRYNGADIGSFADVVCYSFYPSKNMTTGEGGMIVTSDAEIYQKCKLLRNHGQSQKYTHAILGFNYRMTEMQAALGCSQLKRVDEFICRRQRNASFLNANLKDLKDILLPYVPPYAGHTYNQYSILIRGDSAASRRDEFRKRLRQQGIDTAVHYPCPLHWQPAFSECRDVKLPVCEDLARRIVSLPVHPGLDQQDLQRIVEVVRNASERVQ